MLRASRFISKETNLLIGKKQLRMNYHTLERLPKSSIFCETLPADSKVPNVDAITSDLCKKPRHLESGFFTYSYPTQRDNYQFLHASKSAMEELDLNPLEETQSEYFKGIVSGEKWEKNPHPYASAYAGYQFGNFAGQLGDGRVINLFDVPGKNDQYTLQLKGAGLTPFSRFADGKAVLRSSIREYVISESLHAIGIPSTRALAISALPGTLAQRNGAENCAVVCRMAPSWLRVGHFDLCRLRGNRQELRELCDYTIEKVFKNKFSKEFEKMIENQKELKDELTIYDKFYLDVVIRNAKSVAYWHAYGFLNGVLNTDNTSVLGLAIDFGPFAFMDRFDPNYTSNHEDHTLRYSFRNTPSAIWFNMVKMGEAVSELLGAGPELVNDEYFKEHGLKEEWIPNVQKRAVKIIEVAGEMYEKVFIDFYMRLMCARLGITPKQSDHSEVLGVMFEVLQETKIDYNRFFANLQSLAVAEDGKFDYEISPLALLPQHLKDPKAKEERDRVLKELRSFLATFKARVEEEQVTDSVRFERASQYNPLFIPRNWVLEEVIEYTNDRVNEIKTKIKAGEPVTVEMERAAAARLDKLMKMATNPFDRTQWGDELKELESKWCSDVTEEKMMLTCSCSS